MGYKEKVLKAYNEPLSVGEVVEGFSKYYIPSDFCLAVVRIENSHLGSNAVSQYTKRLLKEGKLQMFMDSEGHKKYISKEQLLLGEILEIDTKWKDFPRLKWEIIRLGLRFLQVMSDKTLNYSEFIKRYNTLKDKMNPEMFTMLRNMTLIPIKNNDEHFII